MYDKRKVERALLKSAYLLCFIWWGYEFVFSENGALLREVIFGNKHYPCHVPISWLEKEQKSPIGVSLVQDSNERLAFLVNLSLSGIEIHTTAGIIIPNPTKNGWAKLSLFNDTTKSIEGKEFSCITLPRIVDRIGYSASWGIILPRSKT